MMSKYSKNIFLLLIVILSGCAGQPNTSSYGAGFFSGIWHGLILPFSLIGSIFLDIRIYEFPNTGFFYDLGYTVGLLLLLVSLVSS